MWSISGPNKPQSISRSRIARHGKQTRKQGRYGRVPAEASPGCDGPLITADKTERPGGDTEISGPMASERGDAAAADRDAPVSPADSRPGRRARPSQQVRVADLCVRGSWMVLSFSLVFIVFTPCASLVGCVVSHKTIWTVIFLCTRQF